MFLKSLVLRGFKSFADKTTLVFEPGITIVVGPNGSGKSNIVDSVSWVLGEQGPRSLRGGKMEDVIFAGSRERPALGMADVTLTIDNSSGIIPVEFTEFTISRTLFRSGDSEYRLNGVPCRLLDIQEILSDTGIGREQHTIIGQGQLDEILQADPMQMRGFIEEAAGVAKHRRRKDRALRKIASAESNVARLSDLLAEIRRQLRPLREQAEVSRRHSAVADELSRVLLVSSARELADVRRRVGPGGSVGLDEPIRQAETALTDLEQRLTDSERTRSERFGASEGARDTAWNLSRQVERLTSLSRLAGERERTLRAELAGASESTAQARLAELERERGQIVQLLEDAREAETRALAEVQEMHSRAQELERSAAETEQALGPARAAHRESIAETVRVRTEIGALSGSLSSAEHEFTRVGARRRLLDTQREQLSDNLARLRAEMERLESETEPLEKKVVGLELEAALAQDRKLQAEQRLREIEREAATWRARAEVRAGGGIHAARRLADLRIQGVLGVLDELIEFPPEYRLAVAAIAGPPDSVLVVLDAASASRVLQNLRPGEAIGILVAGNAAPAPPGSTPLIDSLRVVAQSGDEALAGVFLAPTLSDAAKAAEEHPESVFVTMQGGVAAGRLVASGAAEAAARSEQLEHELADAEAQVAELEGEIATHQERLEAATTRLNQADAAIAAAAERLAALDRESHAFEREMQATVETEHSSSLSLRALSDQLDSLRGALPRLEATIERGQGVLDGLADEHSRAEAAHSSATAALEQSRLALAGATERRRLLEERIEYVGSTIKQAAISASGLGERRRSLGARIEEASSIAGIATRLSEATSGWASEAEDAYQSVRSQVGEVDAAIVEMRTRRAGLAGALDDLRARAREQDAGRSEWLVRGRILEEKMLQEWNIEPDQALVRFGHTWEVEDTSKITDPTERNALLDDENLRRKRIRLERDLAGIGQVNPFAAQEFDALTDRERYLADQIADVRKSRRDLFKIVASIDEHIRQSFSDAFEDVSGEYERLLAMLFPGGAGRLRLTDPNDLLQSGIEIEVRPGGKNLKRLSLLSGGEKALAALAILFAIFRARPSPFYVLDEVEAALDDVNLHRFLSLLDDFRQTAQLVVVTHQKRTMEVADVLYGISIRPDGASRVISERMAAISRETARRLQTD